MIPVSVSILVRYYRLGDVIRTRNDYGVAVKKKKTVLTRNIATYFCKMIVFV